LKETIPGFAAPLTDPEATFRKFGMRQAGVWRSAVSTAGTESPPAARLRAALEELGGLYAVFGQFLQWRADLLRTDYLGQLRHVRVAIPPIALSEFDRIVEAELGPAAAAALEWEREPCWSTFARCAYRARYQGRMVAVQLARDPIPNAAFEAFESGVKLIQEPSLREALRPATLAQFRDWVRLSDSPARERAHLEALHSIRDKTLVQYPALIPELSTQQVLCVEWVDGQSVAALMAQGSAQSVQRLAECVLEQLCTVTALDGDFDLESMALTAEGRLTVRRANRMIAIPPPLAHAGLKYISAVLASNAPSAAHMLARLSDGAGSNLETRLLDELSNLEPELKVNLQFPQSAAIFEGNWRALARTGVKKPLFLDVLHRNLVAAGYWSAENSAAPAATTDFIAEAQWPVLGKILRARVGDLSNRETVSDWFIGSGMLFFESLRQITRLAEGLRENDVSVGVDVRQDDEGSKIHQRIRSGILIGMLFIAFLTSVRFAIAAEGAWLVALSAIAVASALALFWFVSRFD
jgi:hypothetical protein